MRAVARWRRGAAIAAWLALPSPVAAQGGAVLAGLVTGPGGAPLAEARVELVESGHAVTAGTDGRFRLGPVAAGTYRVRVARIGFAPRAERVVLRDGEVATLELALEPVAVEIAPLQVTATALPTSVLDAPQAVASLDSTALRRMRAPTLAETIQQLPGVQNASTGPGIGRPVVRGLAGSRVLVVADGQRMEFQQWGEEHAPSVEVDGAAAVEVVRGPASVLYGSDALGGVVNVVPRLLPDAAAGDPLLRGRLRLGYSSANSMPDLSANAEGALGRIGWRALAAGQWADDLRTPAGPLRNSGFRTVAAQLAAGTRGRWGSATLTAGLRDERLQIAEDPAVDASYTGYQLVGSARVRAEARLPLGAHRLEVGAGFERNRRREYDGASAAAVTTGLLADLLTADVRFFHAPLGPAEGAIGLAASRLGFVSDGVEPFLPDYRWWNVGAFAFEQVRAGPATLALGARIDHRELAADADPALALAAQARTWTAASGNVGASVRLTRALAVVANAGRGFRAPQAPELFANGVHEGTLAYEVGNPDLGVETSWNVDAGLRWQSATLAAEATVFRNEVGGFIYYRPTGEREPRTGLEVFRFTQGDALLTGFEASVTWRPARVLELGAGGDAVRGTNRSVGEPLPFMPPLRGLVSARLTGLRADRLGGATASVGIRAEAATRQSRPNPDEVAPPGWARVDLEAGLAWPSARGDLTLDLQVRNVGDALYARHLNRFKGFARETGRHVMLRVGMPF